MNSQNDDVCKMIVDKIDSYIRAWSQWEGDEYLIYNERRVAMEIAKKIVEKTCKDVNSVSNKLYKFRENITFKTTKGFNDTVVGPWTYVYIDESIPKIRMKDSEEKYSFEEARDVCYTWPDCVAGKSIFKKPYIRVWDTWGGHVYYKKDIEEITYFMEYVELERCISMKELYENLPASHFIEYCKDNAFPIKVEVE